MTEKVTNEQIENAYKPAVEALNQLPDSTERNEAQRLLGISENLAHEARDRWKPDRTEDAPPLDASIALRGPALAGWPWRPERRALDCGPQSDEPRPDYIRAINDHFGHVENGA